ncbi:hypothetical protein KR067_002409, partial [Drosophila pandora]
ASMFPAYSGTAAKKKDDRSAPGKEKDVERPPPSGVDWRNNSSFGVDAPADDKAENGDRPQWVSSDDSESSAQSEAEDESSAEETPQISAGPSASTQLRLDFDGKETFYVDKKSNNTYRSASVRSLTRPTKPTYRIWMKRLTDWFPGLRPRRLERSRNRRYIRGVASGADDKPSELEVQKRQEELKELKVAVQREPQCEAHWLSLHRMLALNLDKANRLAVSEHQLHSLEEALAHHPSNERLLHLYTETAAAAYPASQVAILLERMLEKNPFEYTLWTSLIMATQGTMARCNVPDVMRIYENSMRRMHLGHTDASSQRFDSVDTDPIMMKLFNNCCLFLRQSGNFNQLFGLIRMSVELNFPDQAMDFLEATAADEQPLIEFEELVLSSGLPMAQIWIRVELLRQAYHYLPYPQMRHSEADAVEGGLDTQRFVFSSDVCRYAYPLKAPDNRLQLMLLVVQLLKMPVSTSECLAERLGTRTDQFGDSDAVEMMLAGLAERSSYAVPIDQSLDFAKALMALAKDLSVTPSYLPHMIGSELYAATVGKFLLSAAAAFRPAEPRRQIFVVLWFRLQRIILLAGKLSGKMDAGKLHDMRCAVRHMVARDENRDVARMFVEYGTWEFERLERDDDPERAFKIFTKLIQADAEEGEFLTCPQMMLAYVVFAEMLMAYNRREHALHLLCCMNMGVVVDTLSQEEAKRATRTSNRGLELLTNEVRALDGMSPTMLLEEYFQPHKLVLYARARCLMLCLFSRFEEANSLLLDLLADPLSQAKAQTSERRRFLREQLMELRMTVLQLPTPALLPLDSTDAEARKAPTPSLVAARGKLLVSLVRSGLEEFPRNMAMLLRWSTFSTLEWHKLRAQLIRTEAGVASLLHMVVASSCRFGASMQQAVGAGGLQVHIQTAVRNRVMSMFETFLPTNPHRTEAEARQWAVLRKNSLYWRLYLRCLSDVNASFERSKECLLSALDECPWDKAIYIDGATHVPQELGHLQDLMIEKQLRMFAVPEELDILRRL